MSIGEKVGVLANGVGLQTGGSRFESVLRMLQGILTEYLQVNSGTEALSNLQQNNIINVYITIFSQHNCIYLLLYSIPQHVSALPL